MANFKVVSQHSPGRTE